MSDRELLELAAKAVGGKFSPGTTKHRTGETWDEWEWIGPQGIEVPCFTGVSYPLTDDGDALRLAVTLAIDIRLFGSSISGWTPEEAHWVGTLVDRLGRGFNELCSDDPYAATRRAIVRAAAEIGKAMP